MDDKGAYEGEEQPVVKGSLGNSKEHVDEVAVAFQLGQLYFHVLSSRMRIYGSNFLALLSDFNKRAIEQY